MEDPEWPAHDPALIGRFARGLAERLGLGKVECAPWKEGASNAIWSFDPEGAGPGGRFALKVGKLPYWRRLGVEARMLAVLGGSEAPRLVARGEAGDGLPWDWSLIERVEGGHRLALDRDDARRLGALLRSARGKAAGIELDCGSWRSFVAARIEPPLATARPAMDSRVAERFERLLARARALASVGDLLDSLPAGLVHGDLTPLNLVFEPDGSPRLLDWECPRRASVAWDLAGARKGFGMEAAAFRALREAVGEEVPEAALSFADALHQLQVAAWRADVRFGRGRTVEGDFFLVELGEELGRAELLLRSAEGG